MFDNLHVLGVDTDGDNVDNADVLDDGDMEWNSVVRTHRRLVDRQVTPIFPYLQESNKPIFDFNAKLINNTDRLEYVNDR